MATATSGGDVTGTTIGSGSANLDGGSGVTVGGQTGAGGSDGGGSASTAQSVQAAGDSAEQGTDIVAKIAALEAKLAAVETLVREAVAAFSSAEKSRQLDQELAAAGAVDLPTAAALLGPAVQAGTAAAAAVASLKQSKPFLFRKPQASSAMGAASKRDPLAALAEQALATGDKRALLDYLRARRGG
ncbi:MAG: hypothetical protein GC200_08410 [Tepidisphaera sp.]|nr:hypothetical protein [Tepidisphaera sp.]